MQNIKLESARPQRFIPTKWNTFKEKETEIQVECTRKLQLVIILYSS